MKRIIAIAILGLALTGCATNMDGYYATQQKAIEADNNAVMALATAAAQGNQGAIMALALRRSAAGNIAVPQDKAMAWASILVPGLTNLYAIQKNTQVQLSNIEAETQQYGTTMSTLQTISIKGMDEAGKVTFPPVYTVPMGSTPAAPTTPVTTPVETPTE